VEDFAVRAVVLLGAERAVVWDTLARPADMVKVLPLVGDRPLTVVYSHADWDHIWGTGGLSEKWEAIIAHSEAETRFEDEVPKVLEEKRAQCPDSYEEVTLYPPTRTFQTRISVDMGGATLDLHHLPGHTPDTIVGHVPEWGVFLAGDGVETPLPFLNPGSSIGAWIEGLDRWEKTLTEGGGPALVIPAHGQVGGVEIIRTNSAYLRAILKGVDPPIPAHLSEFYRETHASNLVLAREP
jgi:glyoxylase-like metal-dependent hydrolase (beta-lactamase superfamily II)